MKISTLKYFMIDALKNLKRNRTLSTASIATVAATLFILGVFALTLVNVKQGVKEVESKVEAKIFLKDDIKISEQKNLESKIKSTEGVVDVSYESKSQALDKLREQLGEQNKGLVEGLEKDNPMPNSFIVKVEKPEIISKVVDNIKGLSGIESIKDGREIVEKLAAITNTIRIVGIVLFSILIGVSLFLIGNTIKITVYSRRREIGIMKYIGATDWFIRWPFVMEGMAIGIVGALIATLSLYYAYKFAYLKISSGVIMMQLVNPSYVFGSISIWFLLGGILIGATGSIVAIRKFLTV